MQTTHQTHNRRSLRLRSRASAAAAAVLVLTILAASRLISRDLPQPDAAAHRLQATTEHPQADGHLRHSVSLNHAASTTSDIIHLRHIPAGAVLVVTSTDRRGVGHPIQISAVPVHATLASADPDFHSPANFRTATCDRSCPVMAAATSRSTTKPERLVCSDFETRLSCDRPADPDATESPRVAEPGLHRVNRSRRFQVPAFHDAGSAERTVLAHCIAETSRVAAYHTDAQSELSANDRVADVVRAATRLAETIDARLLDHVAAQVGPIADRDRDGRLAVVITPLDFRMMTRDVPVYGCVRERDWYASCTEEPLDCIYVSPELLDLPDCNGILIHELTHAAVYSRAGIRIDASHACTCVPAWLNEAIAHTVELQLAPESPNFAPRLASFRQEPWRYPVVVSSRHSWEDRRGGCRAAGTLFLSTWLKSRSDSPHTWGEDVLAWAQTADVPTQHCERTAAAVFPVFDDCLREWSLQLASDIVRQAAGQTSDDSIVVAAQPITSRSEISVSVAGTATWYGRVSESAAELAIAVDPESEWQISLVEPDGRRRTIR